MQINTPHPHDIGKPAIYLVSTVTRRILEFREVLLEKLQCIGAYTNI